MSSSISLSSSGLQHLSPRDRLQNALTSNIAAGKIPSSDQNALSTALDTIDTSLRASRSASAGQGRPSPQQLQAKVDSLIDGQVDAGKLTADQAKELKQLLADTFAKGPGGAGGPHGHHGPGGPGGAGGPPSGPPPSDPDGDGDNDGGSREAKGKEASGSSSSTDTDIASLLQEILKKLASKTTAYGSQGSTSATTGTTTSPVLVDTSA